jgi:hypothetical protein
MQYACQLCKPTEKTLIFSGNLLITFCYLHMDRGALTEHNLCNRFFGKRTLLFLGGNSGAFLKFSISIFIQLRLMGKRFAVWICSRVYGNLDTILEPDTCRRTVLDFRHCHTNGEAVTTSFFAMQGLFVSGRQGN